MPKISVILTSFNHANFIQMAIDSILDQTYTNFELIILDDCSSDESWELIQQYKDPRIKAMKTNRSGDVVLALNNAIRNTAVGEYIAIHHSDDIWEPTKLEQQYHYLDRDQNLGAVFTNAKAITEDGKPLEEEDHFYFNIFNQSNKTRFEWLRFFFQSGNALCHPSALIRKSAFLNYGLYSHSHFQLPDLDMWVRLCLNSEIHVLPETLVQFRILKKRKNLSANRPDTRIRDRYEYFRLLHHYRSINDFDTFLAIFPTASKYCNAANFDADYALAMICLEQKNSAPHLLFAQNILFENFENSTKETLLRERFNFSHQDFFQLTGQNDIFAVELQNLHHHVVVSFEDRQVTLEQQLNATKYQLKTATFQYNQILNSRSWIYTKPIRKLINLLKHAKHWFNAY